MPFNLYESARELLVWLHDNGAIYDAVMPYDFATLQGLNEQALDLLAEDLIDRGLAEQRGMGGVRLKLTTAGIREAQRSDADPQHSTATDPGAVSSVGPPPTHYTTNFYATSYGASVGGTDYVHNIDARQGIDAESLLRLLQEFRQALDVAQGLTDDESDDLHDHADIIEAEARRGEPNLTKIRRHLTAMAGRVGTAATKGALTVGADKLVELIGHMQTGVAAGS